MIKALLTGANGRKILMLGLSFRNLDKFRAEPGDTFIKIKGEEMNLPIDILLCSGETEAHLTKMVQDRIGPDTIVHVDPKLKS
jgi:hypothetical protein